MKGKRLTDRQIDKIFEKEEERYEKYYLPGIKWLGAVYSALIAFLIFTNVAIAPLGELLADPAISIVFIRAVLEVTLVGTTIAFWEKYRCLQRVANRDGEKKKLLAFALSSSVALILNTFLTC